MKPTRNFHAVKSMSNTVISILNYGSVGSCKTKCNAMFIMNRHPSIVWFCVVVYINVPIMNCMKKY